MSDNPLDRIPSFDRLSLRAVVVPEGVDPGPALAAAGIIDPIALPIAFGEDPPDNTFGDGFTPNVTAVLEYDHEDAAGTGDLEGGAFGSASGPDESEVGAPEGTAGSATTNQPPSAEPSTVNLPAAYGMQPLAPVGQRGQSRGTSNQPPERSFDSISSAASTPALVAPPSPAGGLQTSSHAPAASKARADTSAPADPAIAPVPFVDDKGR